MGWILNWWKRERRARYQLAKRVTRLEHQYASLKRKHELLKALFDGPVH